MPMGYIGLFGQCARKPFDERTLVLSGGCVKNVCATQFMSYVKICSCYLYAFWMRPASRSEVAPAELASACTYPLQLHEWLEATPPKLGVL